ncbi:MAG: hypothetical protein IPJ65_02000 [Archangiaceae bacterium]|nr:hypothetical protein [Archangiaceae bacterium]
MVRLLMVAAALAALASGCGATTKCGDLCNPNEGNTCGVGLTCVSPGRCLVVTDAGPNSCP